MSTARMSPSNIAGRTANTIVCRALVGDLVRSPSLGHRRDQHSCQPRGKGRDHYDSDCFHHRRRSGPARTGREFGPTRRQCHRRDPNDRGSCAETGGASSRVGPAGDRFWHAHQSYKSIGRDRETRLTGGGPKTRTTAQCTVTQAPTQNLTRPSRPSAKCACRCARHRHGCIL